MKLWQHHKNCLYFALKYFVEKKMSRQKSFSFAINYRTLKLRGNCIFCPVAFRTPPKNPTGHGVGSGNGLGIAEVLWALLPDSLQQAEKALRRIYPAQLELYKSLRVVKIVYTTMKKVRKPWDKLTPTTGQPSAGRKAARIPGSTKLTLRNSISLYTVATVCRYREIKSLITSSRKLKAHHATSSVCAKHGERWSPTRPERMETRFPWKQDRTEECRWNRGLLSAGSGLCESFPVVFTRCESMCCVQIPTKLSKSSNTDSYKDEIEEFCDELK